MQANYILKEDTNDFVKRIREEDSYKDLEFTISKVIFLLFIAVLPCCSVVDTLN